MRSSSTSLRISAFYAASFVPYGIQLPFFPLVLASRGLSETEIAVVVGVPMLLRVTTASALGHIADRLGDRRHALVLYCVATLLGALTLWPAGSFLALVAATVAMTLPWTGILPVTDALATTVARRGEGSYGAMRAWGSIAFVAANLVGGVVAARAGAQGILLFLIAGFAGQGLVAFLVPADTRAKGDPVSEGSLPGLGREEAGSEGGVLRALASLAADRRLIGLLGGAGLIQASHAMLYGFASLHWTRLGFSGDAIGALWAVGVVGEILLFLFSARVIGRIGARGLLTIAVFGSVLRWLLFPFLGTDLPVWVALQLLHAATFASTHLGTIHVLTRSVDEHRAATAQGLMVSINGFAMSLATFASGPLYRAWGGDGFFAMAAIAALGGVALLGAARLQPHRAGEDGKTVEPS